MTIRGGGKPRAGTSQAHPLAADPEPSSGSAGSEPRVGSLPGAGRRSADPARGRTNDDSAVATPFRDYPGRYGSLGTVGERTRRSRREYGSRRGGGLVRFLLFAGVLAVLVLAVLATVGRPLVAGAVVGWAYDNPSALKLPFVADLVREDLGPALAQAPSTNATSIEFTVQPGDTPATLLPRLEAAGLIANDRAFTFTAIERSLASQLTAGTFLVRRNMTPDALVTALIEARVVSIPVTFREGLRLEQITAKLQTVQGTGVDPKTFHDLVAKPPATLVGEYPWLQAILPKGASLEGFLYPATYTLKPSTTAEDLVNMMLTAFHDKVGDQLLAEKVGGRTFYQNLVLASIVEQEAQLDAERPLIAGVYANRLNPKRWPVGRLESDPTVFYVNDSLQLASLPFEQWRTYSFWGVLTKQLPTDLPPDLAGYNTYTSAGLPPGPICSPALPSIQAALAPDTSTGYLYFLAKKDGSGTSAFAKTFAEHQANIAKYGS